MCKWVMAKPGYKFVLTEWGLEQSLVRSKYEADTGNLNYKKKVPERWVRENFVMEVKENDC